MTILLRRAQELKIVCTIFAPQLPDHSMELYGETTFKIENSTQGRIDVHINDYIKSI
jgi:hypothetical protein